MMKRIILILITTLLFSSCGNTINNRQNNEGHNSRERVEDSNTSMEEDVDESEDDALNSIASTKLSSSTFLDQANEIENKPVESNPESNELKLNEVEIEITNIMAPIIQGGGSYSVLYKKIGSPDQALVINGRENGVMVSASLIKLFVAATVYEKIDEVKKFDSYDGETEYLLNIMISQSDNEACNSLIRRLGNGDSVYGMQAVNDYCISHGYVDTEMNRLMLDFNGLENYTSVKDCCLMLENIYNEGIWGSAEILGFMKNQHTLTKIPAGIDSDVIVANKTGELANVENDVAIVFTSPRPYILCVMTNDVIDTYQSRKCIKELSNYIYRNF